MPTSQKTCAQMLRRSLLVLAPLVLVTAAGCGTALPQEWSNLAGQDKVIGTESHKDFQTFEYTRWPGIGFYDVSGPVSDATITRQADGSYWLEIRVWDGDGGDSDITWEELENTWEWDSVVDWVDTGDSDQALVLRALAADEVQRMLDVFGAIPVEYEFIAADIDYYMFEDVRWDDRSLSANPNYGYSETIAFAKVEEIVQMLNDFRSASE
jgi:hypothetical protein